MTELILSEFLATMPFRLFAYLPFRNHLRVRKPVLLLIVTFAEFVSLFLAASLVNAGIESSYANLIFLPPALLLFFGIVRMERGKVAFMYVFTMAYVLTARGLSGYFSRLLFSAPDGTWQFGVTTLAVFLITLPFMACYINRTAEMVFETEASGVWKTAWLLPMFSVLLVMLSTHGRQGDLLSVLIRAIMMTVVFLNYYLILNAVCYFQKHLEYEEHIRHLEEISTIRSSQYAMLQSRMEETRRARHDLRQHLMAIQGCIDSQDMNALSEYVRDYGASLPPETMRTFCKNYAVDAVLRYYSENAAAAGIDAEVSFQMDERSVIPEPMLCVLLGNLFENALHACEELEGSRFIRVSARQTGKSMLSIAIDNSSNAPVSANGRLLSTKRDGTGTGIRSVTLIAEQYNGEARFHWKDGVFYASVVLNP